MQKIVYKALVALFIVALGFSDFTQAQTNQAEKIIKVVLYEAGLLNSNGKGIDRDVLDEIKNRGGYFFEYSEMPRARIWKEMEAGTVMMSVSGLQTPERDQFAYFIPYIANRNKALILGTKYTTSEGLMADPNARIAVVRGFKHGAYFDAMIDKIRAHGGVQEVPTIRNLFLMLRAGNRVDVIISQPVFYIPALKDLGIESHVNIYDWDPAPNIVLGLILSKAHFSKQDVVRMRDIVEEMRNDGTLKSIYSKYMSAKDVDEALNF